MIDSTLERQAKSIDELLRRLIEERYGKNLMLLVLILLLLVLLVLLKLIHTQVVHRLQHFNV
jgi:carbon starvation protein CstA